MASSLFAPILSATIALYPAGGYHRHRVRLVRLTVTEKTHLGESRVRAGRLVYTAEDYIAEKHCLESGFV